LPRVRTQGFQPTRMSDRAPSDDRGSAFTPNRVFYNVCSVCSVTLSPRDHLLAHLATQRESRFDIELGVNECIECRISGVARHRVEGLGITRKQVRHHCGGGAGCAGVSRRVTRMLR
jgi:hypothetical protein